MKKKRKKKPLWNEWQPGGRGRPPIFQGGRTEQKALKLIKAKGITGAAEELGVSRPVLAKLAHKAGITLRPGRRLAS